ncbi:hypothetical protein ACFPIJ_40570 [Dactylosporangium cerinum]|uniref:Integral membrane protein n=1 Tax=Dactylosporangium cerinum TaxID=1434730 RepID=A0ABV9W615_9ACTN
MTFSGAKTTGSIPAAFVFNVFAGLWVIAAIFLGTALWQEPPASFGDEPDTLALNGVALTAVAVCAVGAFVCLATAVILGELAKRQTVEAERG